MKISSVFRPLLLLALASGGAPAATVTGMVQFDGKLPPGESIRMSGDAVCQQAHSAPVQRQDIVVDAKNGLANVFVFVKEGVDVAKVPAASKEPAVFDQRGCLYTPRVFGVRAGQPLRILNSDPTLHNVHAAAKVNKGFNVGMTSKGQTLDKVFDKPERMIRIKCDVHGWMTAWVGVMEHPYFAVSDGSGSFRIADVPPGQYVVEAWHEKLGTQTAKLTVGPTGAKAPLVFRFAGK